MDQSSVVQSGYLDNYKTIGPVMVMVFQNYVKKPDQTRPSSTKFSSICLAEVKLWAEVQTKMGWENFWLRLDKLTKIVWSQTFLAEPKSKCLIPGRPKNPAEHPRYTATMSPGPWCMLHSSSFTVRGVPGLQFPHWYSCTTICKLYTNCNSLPGEPKYVAKHHSYITKMLPGPGCMPDRPGFNARDVPSLQFSHQCWCTTICKSHVSCNSLPSNPKNAAKHYGYISKMLPGPRCMPDRPSFNVRYVAQPSVHPPVLMYCYI